MTLTATAPTTGTSASLFRSWAPPLAWGAGLVLAGMGAATMVGDASSPLARGIGLILVALGLAALVWGAASLAQGCIVTPRAALGGVIGALVSLAAVLAATNGRASLIGAAVAVLLLLVTASMVAAERRHPAPPSASVRVIPLMMAAALVAVVATPALGAVQDAALLRDDGTVVVVDPHQGH